MYFFHCRATSLTLNKGFDVLDVQYFDLDNLPEISEDRILKSQIVTLCKKITAGDKSTLFD